MRDLSASQIGLAQRCLHPFTSGTAWPDEDKSRFAAGGIAKHTAFEAHITGEHVFPALAAGLEPADAESLYRCNEHVARFIAEARPSWDWVEAEVRIAYDVAHGTARRLEPDEKRREGEWTGVADLVFKPRDAPLTVYDWKTGRQRYACEAPKHPQLRFLARAVGALWKTDAVRTALVFVADAGLTFDPAELDAFELAVAGEELRALRRRLHSGPTAPKPGPHCTRDYCKLVGQCSATRAALASAYPLEQPLTHEIRSVDHARWILERLPGARAALENVERAVKDYARHTPIPLGDGRVFAWREKSSRRVRIERSDQVDVLRELLGDATDIAISTRFEASIESVERACRETLTKSNGNARGLRKMLDAALATLDRAGAVKVSNWSAPEEFEPKGDHDG